MKQCLLNENKVCDECGDCMRCDLAPNKLCDNCMKCIHTGAEYNAVEIDAIYESEDEEKALKEG